MARIAGIDLPMEKRIETALTYIYGIGPTTAKALLQKTGVNPDTRVKALSDEDAGKLRTLIEREYKVEGALRTEQAMNISASWISALIGGCATGATCRCTDSAPRRTRVPARVRRRPLSAVARSRRSNPG